MEVVTVSAATDAADGFGNGRRGHPGQWAPATVASHLHMAKRIREAVV